MGLQLTWTASARWSSWLLLAALVGCSKDDSQAAGDGGASDAIARADVAATVTLPDAGKEEPFTWAEAKIKGKIELPAGISTSVTSLTVNGILGTTSPSADGSFEVSGGSKGRQGAFVSDSSGKVVLFGWIRPGQTDTISTKTTAAYLLWLYAWSWRYPTANWDGLVDLISRQRQVDTLAAFLDEKLKTNLTFLELSNDADRSALGTKVGQLLVEIDPTWSKLPTNMVLINPAETKSGVTVLIGDKDGTASSDINQITLMNEWRRRSWVFIGRNIDGQITAEQNFELPPTNGLNGVLGSVGDVINGNGAYTPIYYGPIGLGTVRDENDVRKYQLRMVGAGSGEGSGLTADQADKKLFVSIKAFLLDLFIPAFFSLGNFEWLGKMTGSSGMGEFIKELVAQTYNGNLINVGNMIYSGDFRGALLGISNVMMNNSSFRDWLFEEFRIKVMIQLFGNEAAWKFTRDASLKALSALAVVEKILGVYDYMAVWRDIARANPVEDWDITVRMPKVIFTPAQATVACGEKTGFRVTIKNAGQELSKDITYKYESNPKLGHFTSGVNSTYKDNFESTDSTVYYTADPGTNTGGMDQIKVTATQKIAQDKGPTLKIELGQAIATAKVEATCNATGGGYIGSSAYTSGCTGAFSTPSVVYPGDEVAVTAQAGYGGVCGSGFVYMSHAVSAKIDGGEWQTGSSGTGGVYDFCYTGDPQPMIPGGVGMALPDGNSHTITFKIDPNIKCPSCVREVLEGTPCSSNPGNRRNINGPAVVMGGNGGTHGWSTVRFFKIEVRK